MSWSAEQITDFCEDLNDRIDNGDEITEIEVSLVGYVARRLGGITARKRPTTGPRDRLQEIINDLHDQLDRGEPQTEEDLAFAEELQRRVQKVDLIAEVNAILEAES